MAFEVFDYNQDGKICEMDLFAFVKIFGDDTENDLFSKVFAFDILTIQHAINKKSDEIGLGDSYVGRALGKINEQLRRKGTFLDFSVLQNYQNPAAPNDKSKRKFNPEVIKSSDSFDLLEE